jgi:hypothetical protein
MKGYKIRWIQFTYSRRMFSSCILILSFLLSLGFPSGLFHSSFLTTYCFACISHFFHWYTCHIHDLYEQVYKFEDAGRFLLYIQNKLNNIYKNKLWQVYSLEYTDIPKVLFMPHHVSYCCTNVIQGQCCNVPSLTFCHCHTNVIRSHCPTRANNSLRSNCCTITLGHFLTNSVWTNCCTTMFQLWPNLPLLCNTAPGNVGCLSHRNR